MEQLIACNLLAWCLQPNPKDRPQSCTEILAHSFFAAMKEVSAAEVEEEKTKVNLISEITKLVFDRPFQFLFINTDTQRFFKNFDELLFKDDDDIMSA